MGRLGLLPYACYGVALYLMCKIIVAAAVFASYAVSGPLHCTTIPAFYLI